MILVYSQGVRVIVHTANLIYVDWNNKSQGLWMQDFPWKNQNCPSKGSEFESDLIEYLNMLKWPEFSIKLPSRGNFNLSPSFYKKFDYSDAMVRLIASVPGYHSGNSLKKWGHMKLRSILQECTFDEEFKKSPLVYQFSSFGSLDEKWMAEFASSMSAGFSEDKTPLGVGEAQIIWPSAEDVRWSSEVENKYLEGVDFSFFSVTGLQIYLHYWLICKGYAAGNAIPSPLKNVEKEFLKKCWAKWKADHTGHKWFLLTSSNLSKAAWGALQKNNSQLMIRSYELGVLFLPSLIKRHECGFPCTNNTILTQDKRRADETSEMKRTELVTLTGFSKDSKASEVIPLSVPYEFPLQPYSSQDVPWSWDRRYSKKDVYGPVWPRLVQLYSSQD